MTASDTSRRLFAREANASDVADDSAKGPPGLGEASETVELLRALLSVNGRIAFPEERLRPIVSPSGAPAYWLAYRLCDGRTSQREIAKQVGVDFSNLNKAITKWVEAGIAFRIGPKRFPLHLYPVTVEEAKARTSKSATVSTSAPGATAGGRDAGPRRRMKSAKSVPEASLSGASHERSAAADAAAEVDNAVDAGVEAS